MVEPPLCIGARFSAPRHISHEQVAAFADLVDDHAEHHDPTPGQPVVVHGLLLASLPFALTARFGYVGSKVVLESSTPAFAGTTVTTHVEVSDVTPASRLGWRVRLTFHVEDPRGRVVLSGTSDGLVPLGQEALGA
ncbi:hypothetical protein [Streptomyces sp. NPDC002520]